ncbi:rhomboid family intramembrane serine protease [Candidatus Pacearchaeota archaeon]|nr:rhomboid family intramembrane serine protease [Candidatus Pacearchaeota archaeon]
MDDRSADHILKDVVLGRHCRHKKNRFRFYALKLCGWIFVVFLLQLFVNGFTELFLLDSSSFTQIWRFFTAIFLHGGIAHLLYNVFALALFGSMLERFIGGKRFLIVFFVTGILANVVSVNFYGSSLGASGAIFGVIGTLIFIKPLMFVWAFGFPMPLFVAGIIWITGDLMGFFYATGSNVANLAHLSGMFFGILFGFIYRKKLIRLK